MICLELLSTRDILKFQRRGAGCWAAASDRIKTLQDLWKYRHGDTILQHVQDRQLEQRLVEAIVPYNALRRAIDKIVEASINMYLLWLYWCSRLLLA
jgi:hypothetical protein